MVTVRTSYLAIYRTKKATKLTSNLNDRETNRSRTNAQSIPILYIGFLLDEPNGIIIFSNNYLLLIAKTRGPQVSAEHL